MKRLLIGIGASLGIALVGFCIYLSLPATAPANTSHAYEYYYTGDKQTAAEAPEDILPAAEPEEPGEEAAGVLHPQEPDTDPASVTVLVNHEYTLPADYVPENLVAPDVTFQFSYMADKRLMRADAAAALEELFAAAERDAISLCAISGYRSYERQNRIYLSNVKNSGEEYANRYSAPPGHSEHQTGLTMDVSSASNRYKLTYELAELPEGQWLAKNSHRFGFIIRYPEDKEAITGYAYEPWHIRYVGTELAGYLYEQGLSLDEYYGFTAVGHTWVFDFEAAYRLLGNSAPLATPEEEEAEEPEETEEPEAPEEADTPTEPEIPGEPEAPEEGDTSGEPNTPGEPETPEEGDTSGEPSTPGEGETPGEPETPEEGDTSGEPNTPGEIETPGEPGTSEEPNTPGEAETPETPEDGSGMDSNPVNNPAEGTNGNPEDPPVENQEGGL